MYTLGECLQCTIQWPRHRVRGIEIHLGDITTTTTSIHEFVDDAHGFDRGEAGVGATLVSGTSAPEEGDTTGSERHISDEGMRSPNSRMQQVGRGGRGRRGSLGRSIIKNNNIPKPDVVVNVLDGLPPPLLDEC